MKKIRICLEIQGIAEDENGEPCPAGLCMMLDEDSDEVKLKAAMPGGIYTAADYRLITPEEYDRKYEEDGAYGKLYNLRPAGPQR